MPQISIIIPTYNRANLISRAIKSVLAQTYKEFELIIVDDGSKDSTEQVISNFKDERIRYFKRKINQGQNVALNFGVCEAKGNYVVFLDSDDEWLPEFLKKMISVFNKDQTLGAVYSRAYYCSNKNHFFEGYQFNLQGNVYKEVLEQGYLSYMITIMVRMEIIDKLKPYPFDPTFIYGQDDDFCFRVAKKCRIGLIKEPLAVIHNDGEITGSEASISSKVQFVAEGRYKLIEKYKEDILSYCGKDVLALKYLSSAKLFLRANNIKMASFSLKSSLKEKKSVQSLLLFIYCHSSILRWLWKIAMNFYHYLFTKP